MSMVSIRIHVPQHKARSVGSVGCLSWGGLLDIYKDHNKDVYFPSCFWNVTEVREHKMQIINPAVTDVPLWCSSKKYVFLSPRPVTM